MANSHHRGCPATRLPDSIQPAPPCQSVTDAAGLLHQQRPGGEVPGLQAQLEIAVIDAAGGVGQVQGRRAGPADAQHFFDPTL